jgi:hypothetical protein
MTFPSADRPYTLIMDDATCTADTSTTNTAEGLVTFLLQKDQFDNLYAISNTSCQLKDHDKNYTPFLLESAAAVRGMDIFNEYLKGKKFILLAYHKLLEKWLIYTQKP